MQKNRGNGELGTDHVQVVH